MRLPWPWPERDAVAPLALQEENALSKAGFAEEALSNLEPVYRFALRLTGGSESDADNVVQETFIRAYRSWAQYERGTNCRAWLFTICRNEFLRMRTRASKKAEVAPLPSDSGAEALAAATLFEEAVTADPERAFFESLVDEEVTRAIDALPDEFREAVVLSDLNGLSYPEVAAVLEIPVGTVKSRLYRGRRLLQQSLYEYAVEMGYIRRGVLE